MASHRIATKGYRCEVSLSRLCVVLSFSSLTSFEMERNAGWLESTM